MVNHSVALKDVMYHIPGLFERALVSHMKEIAVRFHLTIMCKFYFRLPWASSEGWLPEYQVQYS